MIRARRLTLFALLFLTPSLAQDSYQPQRPGLPFPLKAPPLAGVREADQVVSRELLDRYEGAATQSAAALASAAGIRRNLASQGMLLNSETAVAITRMTLYLQTSLAAMQEHDWEYARISLERAEYVTDKVLRVVGGK